MSLPYGRPAGEPLDWASDDAWNDPGEDWDGEPPTADPSALAAQGFKPDQPVAADHANYHFRDLYQRAAYVDAIDAQNYTHVATVTVGSGASAGDACALTWSPERRLLYLAGGVFDDEAFSTRNDGVTWVTEYTSAGDDLVSCATRDRNEADADNLATAILVQDVASASIATRGSSGGSWVTTALTDSQFVRRVVADPFLGGFWVAGQNTGIFPAVWRFTDVGGGAAFVQASYAIGTGPLDPFDCIAVGRGRILVAGFDSPDVYIYSKDASTGALSAVTHPGTSTERVMDLLYVEPLGMFVMLVAGAGTSTKVYRSSLGTSGTWSTVSGTIMASVDVNAVSGGCVRGSTIVVPVGDGTDTYLAISHDAGLTWELLADPILRSTTAVTTVARVLDRRFAALGYEGSLVHALALGLRTGRR
jgi:hypothetical protein